RSDTGLNDGKDVGKDLSGGYYDAGDHMKFGLPMAYSMSMLAWGVEEYTDAYAKSGQLDEALDAVKWGTDYFLKSIVKDEAGVQEFYGQVGQSTVLKDYWGSHESLETSGIERPSYKIDRENPGSDLAAETAASLASASIIFRDVDSAYSEELLTNAKLMFDFAEQYQGKYSDAIDKIARKDSYESYSGYVDELGWGAAWLHKATGEASYLSKAENYYNSSTGGNLHTWTTDWDMKNHGTAVLLAQASDNSKYKSDVEGLLNAWTDTSGNSGIKYTEGGLAWLTQWGSLGYTANTAMLAGIYSDTVNDGGGKYSEFVANQIDYILGDNPTNFSYMVGFGDNYSQQPHHQTAQGRDGWDAYKDNQPNGHILYGALVGGPEAADDYSYTDDRTNYVSNEVALNYNAGLTGALAYMYDKFGGEALNDAELNALPDVTVAGV
ncbi:MAG: glycoside hydrolase family 9 protein, partial [Xenococcaceae cyanobacterium]